MNTSRILIATTLGLSALLAQAAQAAEYRKVLTDKSAITFSYTQMGVKMDGRFKRFTPQLAFDPAKPAAAHAQFDVDLASIDAGSSEADSEVVGKSWLNSKAFPTARFVSSSIKPVSGNRYEVSGKLSIKGNTRDISFPATFTPNGQTGLLEGGFTIRRGDFAVGEGEWSKFDIVANDVQVKFRLTATP